MEESAPTIPVDDVLFARKILDGDAEALRAVNARFGPHLAGARERHARDGAPAPDAAAYDRLLIERAARALLAASPIHAEYRLDPFVARIAQNPDFAFAVPLIMGVPAAWEAFRERFGPFLRATFAAGGRRGVEITALVEEVVSELQGRGARAETPPIARYGGATPMKPWLFVFVRRAFGGGVGQALTKTSAFAVFDSGDESSSGSKRDETLDDRVLDAAGTAVGELDGEIRRVLADRAAGLRFHADAPMPEGVAKLLHESVNDLFRRVAKRVAQANGWLQFEAERLLIERARRRTYEHMRGIHEG